MFKKFSFPILILFITVLFGSGCQGTDPKKDLIGQWELDKESTKSFLLETNGEMGPMLAKMADGMEMKVKFQSDNKYEGSAVSLGVDSEFSGTWAIIDSSSNSVTIETTEEDKKKKLKRKLTFINRDLISFDSNPDRKPGSSNLSPRLRRVK